MAKKILIIDDEEDVLKMVDFIFRKHGFATLAASNGQRGLELAGKEKPDLIILDILMPVMNGIEVAQRLKNDRELCDIPLVLLTASADHIDEKIIECKACEYILKPFDYQDILKKVNNILDIP